jgi:prevent-host-death family protein
MRDVPISEFKAKCCGLIERVRKTARRLRITRHGSPVAEVIHGSPVAEVIPVGADRKPFVVGDMVGTAEIVGDILSPVINSEKIDSYL